MSGLPTVTRSLRTVRVQAVLPRALAAILVTILSVAGLRAIITPPPRVPVQHAAAPSTDQGAEAFAEAFARQYLTWSARSSTERAARLQPFLAGLDQTAGLQPAAKTSQTVAWTAPVGEQRSGGDEIVTVAAGLGNGQATYLSVPVTRDSSGFMSIEHYPAIVGPPMSDTSANPPNETPVSDPALTSIVERAVTNYLAGNQNNLQADLTPNAMVSIPAMSLTVSQTQTVTWAGPSTVAVQVLATDPHQNFWTLRYLLGVRKTDRWYVSSLEIDPTFPSGG